VTAVAEAVRLEPLGSFAELGDAWDRLAVASRNIFATREWLEAWWRHFGAGGELALTACYDGDGDLFAILPLCVWRRRGLRVLRFVGHGPSDLLGPICAPQSVPAAQAALRTALTQTSPRWNIFLGEQLLGAERWGDALGARIVRTTGFPIVRFAEGQTWDDFLATKPSQWRSEVRRRARKLADGRDVEYRLVDAGEDLQNWITSLFRLHAHRWEGIEHNSPFTGGGRDAFHREVADITAARGWLRLWFILVDGEPVAARYGWRFGETHHNYQAGRERAWDRYGVGQLLVLHTLRSTLEEGAYEYRFLRGDESYKYEYAQHDPRLDIVARGGTAVGSAMLRAGLAAYDSPLRELLRRRAGA
jgi:CelD/BcsL family acetyltransferase involved in cellulose biosynthesis